MPEAPDSQRLDRWLWTVRIFKTRSLAAKAVRLGQVYVDGQRTKASRELRPGDAVEVRTPARTISVMVQGLVGTRVSAQAAQALYKETAESLARREAEHAARRAMPQIKQPTSKPDKRARSLLRHVRGKD